MSSETLVSIDNLSFGNNGEEILRGIHVEISPGEVFVFIGPSGSGKSTLLKLTAGLFYPKQGHVEIDGIDVHKAPMDHIRKLRKKMGFVFQDGALISNICIFDNIALPLRYHTNLNEDEIMRRVSGKMDLLDIEKTYNYLMPAQLSLGLRRKVGFARALIMDPEIIFFDEPTASFDSHAIEKISSIIKDLQNDLNVTSVIVSGDISIAYAIADRIAILKSGKIIQTGTSDEIRNSKDPDVILMTS